MIDGRTKLLLPIRVDDDSLRPKFSTWKICSNGWITHRHTHAIFFNSMYLYINLFCFWFLPVITYYDRRRACYIILCWCRAYTRVYMRVYVHRDVEVQGWWKSIAPPQCFEHFIVVCGGEATVLQFVTLHRVGCLRGVYNVHSYILYNI